MIYFTLGYYLWVDIQQFEFFQTKAKTAITRMFEYVCSYVHAINCLCW